LPLASQERNQSSAPIPRKVRFWTRIVIAAGAGCGYDSTPDLRNQTATDWLNKMEVESCILTTV
jgi:hypothetical protein